MGKVKVLLLIHPKLVVGNRVTRMQVCKEQAKLEV